MLVFACLLSLAVLALVPAAPAYAGYNVVTDEYPATQDLGTLGDPIYASEIPDGTYSVIARTSSRMCIMYETNGDAANNVNRERCFVQVSGGQMIAAFYISKAYTRIYMGSAEEAASLSPDGIFDAPQYLVGEPAEGYVPHRFVIAIPALNSPMVIATFAGGNHELESPDAKWFTRDVVFIPGSDMLRAIEEARSGGGEEQQPDEQEVQPEPEQQAEPEPQQQANDQSQQPGGLPGATQQNGDGTSGGAQAEQQEGGSEQSADGSGAEGAEGQGGTRPRRGILISPTNLADRQLDDASEDVVEAEEEAQGVVSPSLVVGLVLIALVALGAGARVALFSRGRKLPEAPVREGLPAHGSA